LPAARHHIADRAAPSRSYADAAYTLAELQARANQTPAEVVARSLLTSETDPRNAVAVLISPYGSEVAQALVIVGGSEQVKQTILNYQASQSTQPYIQEVTNQSIGVLTQVKH